MVHGHDKEGSGVYSCDQHCLYGIASLDYIFPCIFPLQIERQDLRKRNEELTTKLKQANETIANLQNLQKQLCKKT